MPFTVKLHYFDPTLGSSYTTLNPPLPSNYTTLNSALRPIYTTSSILHSYLLLNCSLWFQCGMLLLICFYLSTLCSRFACLIHHCIDEGGYNAVALNSQLLCSSLPQFNFQRSNANSSVHYSISIANDFHRQTAISLFPFLRCSVLDGTEPTLDGVAPGRRGVRRRLVATISNTAVDGAKEKVINRMFMSTKSSAYQFSLRPLRGSLPRRFPRSLPISCP